MVTLGASLLRNLLSGKGIVRAGSGNKKEKEIVRTGYRKEWHFLKYKSIIRMNQDLMEFFEEIICLENKKWGIRNKPSWICRCRDTLDCFIL